MVKRAFVSVPPTQRRAPPWKKNPNSPIAR
jgi:hypothetical protein